MKSEENKIKRLKILIVMMMLIIVFESAAFTAFVTCNAIFWKDYEVAMEKAAYVDKMATKEYLAWRENR